MKQRLIKLLSLLTLFVIFYLPLTTAFATEHKCYVVGADDNHYIVLSVTNSLKKAKEITRKASIELRGNKFVKVKKIVECAEDKSLFISPAANELDKTLGR